MLNEYDLLYLQIKGMNRLSFSELAIPGEDRLVARYKLLISIRENTPEVFRGLKGFVDIFGVLVRDLEKFSEKKNKWFILEDLDNITHQVKIAKELKDSLILWAENWNLNEDWFLSTAFHIIENWYFNPNLSNDLIVFPADIQDFFKRRSEEIIKIGLHESFPKNPSMHFNPGVEMKNEFLENIKNYIYKIEEVFLENGWEATKSKRDRGGGIQKHFDWFVKYQIQNESLKKIVQDYHNSDPDGKLDISEAGVKKAVQRVAKDIGVNLRKSNKKGT